MNFWVQDRLKSIEDAFTPEYCKAIERVVDVLVKCFQDRHTLFICGNGGSAADAQHIAAEFIGRFLLDRKGLPAIALATNPAIITAWTNDHEFDTLFARQLESLGKSGDILWAISTSGKSKNVMVALETAKNLGIITIGMAGNSGGLISNVVDYPLFVKNPDTPRIQEIHLLTYHRICEQVEWRLFFNN